MSKVDRFIEALTKDVDLSGASFMGLSFPMVMGMLRSAVSDHELEKMIDNAAQVWGTLSE